MIFRRGAPGRYAYCVSAGRVDLVDPPPGRQLTFGPGDVVGALEVLTGAPYECSATAVGPVSVVPVDRADVLAATGADADAVEALVRRAIAREMGSAAGAEADMQGAGPGRLRLHDLRASADPSQKIRVLANEPARRADSACTDWARLRLTARSAEVAKRLTNGVLDIETLPFLIGRKPGLAEIASSRPHLSLALHDDRPFNLSRRHFAIESTSDGLVARDLGSQLGSIVNGMPLGVTSPSNETMLRQGRNAIVLGSAQSPFRFTLEVEATGDSGSGGAGDGDGGDAGRGDGNGGDANTGDSGAQARIAVAGLRSTS